MRAKLKRICIICVVFMLGMNGNLCALDMNVTYAHSGRTDASGGHKDNKNKSGLGNYHYHCGGYPAHLHEGGICPYTGGGTASGPQQAPPEPERVVISDVPTEMKPGSSQGFTYSVENGTSPEVTVESGNPDVIVVNADNTLKAVGVGEASIKVSSANASEIFTVAVKPVEVETLEAEIPNLELEEGEEAEVTINVLPVDATDKTLKWASSNENVMTVTDGKVRAIPLLFIS